MDGLKQKHIEKCPAKLDLNGKTVKVETTIKEKKLIVK